MFFRKKNKIKEETNLTPHQNNNLDPLLSTRQIYGITLKSFFPDLEEFITYLSRLDAILEIGDFGEEEIENIEDTIEKAESTLEMYLMIKGVNEHGLGSLDGQCLDVDYRIRKSLEMEINGLKVLLEGIKNGDLEASQTGLDKSSKAVGLLTPIISDISEIIIETTFY